MSKSKGRTGAHMRANIQPPPTAAELEAAKREAAQIEGRLAGLAAAHPSVKTWKARLRAAQAIIARAPRDWNTIDRTSQLHERSLSEMAERD